MGDVSHTSLILILIATGSLPIGLFFKQPLRVLGLDKTNIYKSEWFPMHKYYFTRAEYVHDTYRAMVICTIKIAI